MEKLIKENLCPCHSGKYYHDCCLPFHHGELPAKAQQLMRSRYSAYAKQLASYIIDTTHPSSPYFKEDRESWMNEILLFSHSTQFEGLDIIDFIDGEKIAFVTFFAHLTQNDKNVSFKEKSRFEKIGEKWFYLKRVD